MAAGALVAGRYRIVALLGAGAMGRVYRAEDLKLEQPVALKFLSSPLRNDAAALTRLRREVRLARQIAHANVCRVFDIVETPQEAFISMELVSGENLASLLRRIGRLPIDKGLEVARQLCAGVAAAHAAGVLHRDLKPANIMLDAAGEVRITDFGLSGLNGEGGEALTGTPAYMSPEQLSGGRASASSDLYAVGLILYEIFTGKRAFEGLASANPQAVAPPSRHLHGLDPRVESTILQCLCVEPAQRPASPAAVAAGLPSPDQLQIRIHTRFRAKRNEAAWSRIAWCLLLGSLASSGAVLLMAAYAAGSILPSARPGLSMALRSIWFFGLSVFLALLAITCVLRPRPAGAMQVR